MTTETAAETSQWVTRAEAASILGVRDRAVDAIARDGLITRLKVPHSHVRFLRADVVALAVASVVPKAD